jgi:hypothetical protein
MKNSAFVTLYSKRNYILNLELLFMKAEGLTKGRESAVSFSDMEALIMADLDELFDWFNENREQIIEGHRGEEVLLKDKRVIGYYPDVLAALETVNNNGFQMGDFLIQTCNTCEEDTMYYYNEAVTFG